MEYNCVQFGAVTKFIAMEKKQHIISVTIILVTKRDLILIFDHYYYSNILQ